MIARAPHSLGLTASEAGVLHFDGPGSRLRLTRLIPACYEVRYDFKSCPVDESLEAASNLLYDAGIRGKIESGKSIEAAGTGRADSWEIQNVDDDGVVVVDGDWCIKINNNNGDIEIRKGEQLIHGGKIGSPDTVLPRFPIRVSGISPAYSRGVFSFPLNEDDQFFGLGDKGGTPDRRGRRVLMHNRDALGYKAAYSDPLYKSIPFFIKYNRRLNICMGMAIMAPNVISMDFGVESPCQYSCSLENGPYRYVVILGRDYRDILDSYCRLTGYPALPPVFTFGFLGSSMDYTEPDDAVSRIEGYLDKVEQHGIPCEGLYLSSGYYKSDDGYRHIFEWNRRKFPNPDKFLQALRNRGYHIACNIKPGVLVSHPLFEEFKAKNCLLPDSDGEPYCEYYWGNDAAFWDFRSDEALRMWKKLLKEELISRGVDGLWNDNNEVEIEDMSVPAYSQRSMFALRMSQVAYETLLEAAPGKRPWVISRSGGMGLQRYARTWSGDNASTWESLYFNNFMGFSLGLSGLPFFGHDIGGFFGGHPEPELFLRWCQSAVFQPRFVIHSWRRDGVPTELWHYEEQLPALRDLVLQHYEFMPYTYSLAYQAHGTGLPLQRMLLLEFPEDDGLTGNESAYMYGDGILVPLILEPGQDGVRLRLPSGVDWYNREEAVFYRGGDTVELTGSDHRTLYLQKSASIVSRAPGTVALETGYFDNLDFDFYPGNSVAVFEHFEDDGVSMLHAGRWNSYRVMLTPSEGEKWIGSIVRTDDNSWRPSDKERRFCLSLAKGFVIRDGAGTVRGSTISILPPEKGEGLGFTVERA